MVMILKGKTYPLLLFWLVVMFTACQHSITTDACISVYLV